MVTEEIIGKIKDLGRNMLKRKSVMKLHIEQLTGSLVSTLLAVGKMARLYTRELYAA